MWAREYILISLPYAFLRGLKNPTSSGWVMWDEWGGRQRVIVENKKTRAQWLYLTIYYFQHTPIRSSQIDCAICEKFLFLGKSGKRIGATGNRTRNFRVLGYHSTLFCHR